jgi:hypothetical protein
MSSPVDFDALPYAQRLQALLLAQPLPNVVNLGKYNFSPDGTRVEQDGFIRMTEQQLHKLARQMQAQPSVTHLNLCGNRIGPEGMRLLAGPIAMQTGLKTLILGGTCLLCCFDGGVVCIAGEGGRECVS